MTDSASQIPRASPLTWALLLALGLIWGGSFPAVEVALTGFGPLMLVSLRVSMAAVILLVIAFASGVGLPDITSKTGRRIWLHCMGLAVFSHALPFSLLSWGQLYVTSGFAGINMAVVPLLILPLGFFLIPGEVMNARKIIGFVIGFCGVAVLIGPGIFASTGADVETLARLACTGAAGCYAIGSIITRLSPKTPLVSFSAATLLIAGLIMVPISIVVEGVPTKADPTALMAVVYLGVIPTALATLLLVRIINVAGPSFLSLVNYQVPVWAVIIGVVLLSEPLPSQFIGALALILFGLAISQAPAWRRFRP